MPSAGAYLRVTLLLPRVGTSLTSPCKLFCTSVNYSDTLIVERAITSQPLIPVPSRICPSLSPLRLETTGAQRHVLPWFPWFLPSDFIIIVFLPLDFIEMEAMFPKVGHRLKHEYLASGCSYRYPIFIRRLGDLTGFRNQTLS